MEIALGTAGHLIRPSDALKADCESKTLAHAVSTLSDQ